MAGSSNSAICDRIVFKAAERWEEEEGDYRDDITAIVVRLQDLFTAPAPGSTS